MTVIVTLFGTVETLSLAALLFVLAKISERFGGVVKMPAYYRWYYIGIVFLLLATTTHLIVAGAHVEPASIPPIVVHPLFLLLTYHLPLAVGATISLVATWLYWRWLILER